jgi:hypothetical protein
MQKDYCIVAGDDSYEVGGVDVASYVRRYVAVMEPGMLMMALLLVWKSVRNSCCGLRSMAKRISRR